LREGQSPVKRKLEDIVIEEDQMRRHLLFFACTVLLAWSGPVNAEDRTFDGYDCQGDCAAPASRYRVAENGQSTDGWECLLASDSLHEGCLADAEDPDREADDDDDVTSIDAPIDEWT
jgi:hypothetical protein